MAKHALPVAKLSFTHLSHRIDVQAWMCARECARECLEVSTFTFRLYLFCVLHCQGHKQLPPVPHAAVQPCAAAFLHSSDVIWCLPAPEVARRRRVGAPSSSIFYSRLQYFECAIYEESMLAWTMALPVPNYIWLVLGLGGAGSVANTFSACGACCRSLWVCVYVFMCMCIRQPQHNLSTFAMSLCMYQVFHSCLVDVCMHVCMPCRIYICVYIYVHIYYIYILYIYMLM